MTSHEHFLSLLKTTETCYDIKAALVVTQDKQVLTSAINYLGDSLTLSPNLRAIADCAKWSGKCKESILYTSTCPSIEEAELLVASGISMVVLAEFTTAITPGLDKLWRNSITTLRWFNGSLTTYMRCVKCSKPNFYSGHNFYCGECSTIHTCNGALGVFASSCFLTGELCEDCTNFNQLTGVK